MRLLQTPNRLCVVAGAWMALVCNTSFWSLMYRIQGGGLHTWLFAASLFIVMVGLNLFLLRLLSPGRLFRPMLSLLLVLAAASGWFMDTYGVAIDSDMLRNALQTNAAEARDFLGWSLGWHLLWQAVLPALVLWRIDLPPQGFWRETREWLGGSVAGLVLVLVAGLPMYSSYASFFRNQDVARYLISPANVLVGSVRLAQKSMRRSLPFEPVGLDARRTAGPDTKPLLVLMVVGETARAANFSLGGYARDTNPKLAQRDVLYFPDVTACGTSTAVSVPCMFSELPRAEFRGSRAADRDTVLDILQRAGLAVKWIDNQTGCKKVCDRVPHESGEAYAPTACHDGECLDTTLPAALRAQLDALKADTVLVMHAMGSHGPAYYRRVPDAEAAFRPYCATERLDACTDEEILNAYDNTIVYTDAIVDALVGQLAARADTLDSVLFYVSDHGESLGENGLYLHGQPWVIAPDLQKKVPMLLWFSAGAPGRLGIDQPCVRNRLGAPVSHDNISHTLLGLASVATSAYRPPLDLLAACRHPPQ